MLAIRLQRTGRRGTANFRVVVQDSRQSPSSHKVVAQLGSYDPHSKTVILDKDLATKFLTNGAQPSYRAVKLLSEQGVKMPAWVAEPAKKAASIRNVEKLRRNRPAGAKDEATEAAESTEPVEESTAAEDAIESTQAAESPAENTGPDAAEAERAE